MDIASYRQIMDGRAELLKALEDGKRQWGRCAAINIIFPDSTHISPNQACHAGLDNEYEGNKQKGSIAVVSALMKPVGDLLDEEEAYHFLDWLLNRSPYASTFITKSAEEALYTKTTISSSFHPSNLMAAGMVASRRLWEYPMVARVMVALSKAGVNEDLAFYLGHIVRGKFDMKGNFDFAGCLSGHCSIDPCIMGGKELLRFLNHDVLKPNKTYHESRKYNGYDAMYGTRSGKDISMASFIHSKFPYKGAKEAVNVNPFPVDLGGDKNKSTTYEELINRMVDFQHTIFKEIGFVKEEKAA